MRRILPAWPRIAGILLIGLAAGCSTPAPAPPAGETGAAKTNPVVQPKVPEAGAQQPTAGSPAAAAPKAAASPAAAGSPVAANAPRVEPKGRAVYAWHTAIAPIWFDPQENPTLATPYGFQYALHDAVVKHMPGKPFAPSLAESYDIAPDFKSATFKLRPNLKFHDGTPVTVEDVKFTFEKYRGANAKLLHDKTSAVETPDARTIKFTFKEPFLDFLVIYGSPASGAGWVVPKAYYEKVGPNGFKQNPIGAGPYKLVKQTGGAEFEFEAFTDYWRKTPNIKTLVYKSIPEDATRVAALQTGEADFLNLVQGQLVETVRQDAKLQLAPVLTSLFWIEFPGYEKPDSPFNKIQVRQAVSLALDRKKISESEEAGLSGFEGNWIPLDWPGTIKRPMPEYNLAKAKQLMAEAGYPNGFDSDQVTPLPPYNSVAERVITSLREIGIRLQLNSMERAAFASKLAEGPGALKGIILNLSGAPGDAASRIRAFAICPPKGASSRTCDAEIDQKFTKYEASANPTERTQLLTEIQERILDQYIFVPLYRQAAIQAQGPRVANKWDEIWGAIPQYPYIGPYEDLRLKD